MTDAAIAAAVASVALLAFVAWRARRGRQERNILVAYSLRFPSGLSAESVEAFLGSLSGLLPPWWRRLFSVPFVILETTADERGIEHRLLVSQGERHHVEDLLQAHLPSVRYDELEAAEVDASDAATYRISTPDRPLRSDAKTLSVGVSTSLQPLEPNEHITVQWTLTPAGPVTPARRVGPTGHTPWWFGDDGTREDSEAVAALKAKRSSPLLLAVARVGVLARSRRRAHQLMRRVETPWHAARAPGVQLRRRWLPEGLVARQIRAGRCP